VIVLLSSLLLTVRARGKQYYYSQPNWDETLKYELIEDHLQHEPISSITSLSSFLKKKDRKAYYTHTIRVVTLKNGLVGIFKSGKYHYGEVAAYRLSKLLGFNLVPPTVYRMIEGVEGSLQFYIDAPDFRSQSNPTEILARCGDQKITMMKHFYYIAGQWDIHRGNQIIFDGGDRYYLALIDNSGIFDHSHSRYGREIFVARGEENFEVVSDMSLDFPYHKGIKVEVDSSLKKFFRSFLTDDFIRHFLPDELTYVVWQHRLWIKWPSPKRHARTFTTQYYRSILQALHDLTYENLEEVWAEVLAEDPAYGADLIALTLNRRDEVVQHALTYGEIVDD